MDRNLTPREAEDVVEQRIQDFGLDALPRVQVDFTAGGDWLITWDRQRHIEPPMTDEQWRAWVERHVGTLNPELLETLEG